MLKIRLRRMGAKFQPHYRIVVADARAPRDGRFVTILGYYDPRTKPPTVHVDEAQLIDWARKGAQPTEAVVSLLRRANLAAPVIAAFDAKNPSHYRPPTEAPAEPAAEAAAEA